MGGFTAGLAEAIRVTFRREALPPPPPQPGRPAGRGLRSLLLAPEPLPPDLPPPQAARPAGRSLRSLLLAPEPLPPDLPPAPRRGGRLLAWLLSPESLDP